MDYIPGTSYLQVHPETLQMVRKEINMDKPGEMKEAVRILDEWVKQQPHFMEKNIPHHYLEMTIVNCKGSVERAKRLIEDICTVRTLKPQYFEPRDLREYHDIFKNNYSVIAMPRLTSKNHRILIMKIKGKTFNHIVDAVNKYNFSCLDYLKVHDYHSGIITIVDLTEADLHHLISNVNLMEMKNYAFTCFAAYGPRIKRVHLITPSKIIQTLVTLFTPFVYKKTVDRIVVNTNVEELLQYYSKDTLPRDYGGNDKTILELQEEILVKASKDEHVQHMKFMSRCKIDTSLCPSSQLNDEDVYGTFRSLSID